MKRLISNALLIGLLSFSNLISASTYPDAKLPGTEPLKFASGFISLPGQNEFRLSMSPDGTQIFYSVFSKAHKGYAIYETHQNANGWSEPSQLAGTRVNDLEPFVSADARTLYFTSKRNTVLDSDWNLWKMTREKAETAWSNPQQLDFSLVKDSDWTASETENGNFYFARFENDQIGDIYFLEKGAKNPLPIAALNSEFNDFEPFVSPREDYLIFASNRAGGFGGVDLYISRKNTANQWGKPRNLGRFINTKDDELSPSVSADGRYLFFNRNGDLYWVSILAAAQLIE